jgi:hypothetical protein
MVQDIVDIENFDMELSLVTAYPEEIKRLLKQ